MTNVWNHEQKLSTLHQVKAILDVAESQHQQPDIWLVCLNK